MCNKRLQSDRLHKLYTHLNIYNSLVHIYISVSVWSCFIIIEFHCYVGWFFTRAPNEASRSIKLYNHEAFSVLKAQLQTSRRFVWSSILFITPRHLREYLDSASFHNDIILVFTNMGSRASHLSSIKMLHLYNYIICRCTTAAGRAVY